MKHINKKIGVGVVWNFLELFLARGASTLFAVFLATLLAPKDFGLIAILAVVFELSHVLVNAGFTQALIRSKSTDDNDLSTAFWGNLAIAFLVYLVVFLLSGPIASFFAEPLLRPMLRVLGIGIVVSAFKIVQMAILSRRMHFRPQMAATTIGVLVSGLIALFLAYRGYGVWSLVSQMVISQIVSTFLLWWSTKWSPKPIFDVRTFRRLFDFGKYLALANLLTVAFNNSYALVIAKLFSSDMTGLYYFANKVSNLASKQITDAIQKSSFPALATLQDEDAKLRHKYRQILQVSMAIIAPAMFLFIALSKSLFELLFEEHWGAAVIYAQWLSIVGLLYPVHALNVNVLMVKGRSDLNLKLNVIKKTVQITLLVAAIPFGVIGIVIGQVLGSLVALVPNSYYTYRLIDYGFMAQIADVARPILAGTIGGCAAWFAVRLPGPAPTVMIPVATLIGGIAYLAASVLLRAEGIALLFGQIRKIHARVARSAPR